MVWSVQFSVFGFQRSQDTEAQSGDLRLPARLGTPVMAYDLWGVSPLYEDEDFKVGRIPTVTPIDQVLDKGNCGEVTNRGEEACECAVKLTHKRRRQPHYSQSCEVTDRNSIQGRCRQVSEPTLTKPSSFIRIGKSRACAAKAIRLILGDPSHGSAKSIHRTAEPASVNCAGVRRKSAEVIVLFRRIPVTTGRTEP
jgi:hypothetical protein